MAEPRTLVLRVCLGTALGLSLALSVFVAVFGVYLVQQVKDLRAKDELLVSLVRDNQQSLATVTQLLTRLSDSHQAGAKSRGSLAAGVERQGAWLQDHHNATDKDLQDLREDLRSLQEAAGALEAATRESKAILSDALNKTNGRLDDVESAIADLEVQMTENYRDSKQVLKVTGTAITDLEGVVRSLVQASQNASEEQFQDLARLVAQLLKSEQNSTSTVLASLRSTHSDVQTLQSNLQTQQTQVTGLVTSVANNKRALDALASTLSSQDRLMKEIDSELTSNTQSLASISSNLTQLGNKSSTALLRLGTLQSGLEGFQVAFSEARNTTRQRLDSLTSQMTESEALLLNITSDLDYNKASHLNMTALLDICENGVVSLQNSSEKAHVDILQYVRDIQELLWSSIDNASWSANVEEAEEMMVQLWNVTVEIENLHNFRIPDLKTAFDSLNDTTESATGIFELAMREVNSTETPMTAYDKVKDTAQNLARNAKSFQDWLLRMRKSVLRERLPRSCQEYRGAGFSESGIYRINPHDGLADFPVYCHMDIFGKGWVVIQRRMNGSVDFYRDWEAYKNGFGNLSGEFWLGNEKIRRLTQSGRDQLRIELEDWQRSRRYAEYRSFLLGNESSNYTLHVIGYSGDAGDSLGGANGYQFSTRDRGPQTYCASSRRYGAWWYGSYGYDSCGSSNLNGRYYTAGYTSRYDGVNWYLWRHDWYSYMSAEMKLH